jgi:hypothetical protein
MTINALNISVPLSIKGDLDRKTEAKLKQLNNSPEMRERCQATYGSSEVKDKTWYQDSVRNVVHLKRAIDRNNAVTLATIFAGVVFLIASIFVIFLLIPAALCLGWGAGEFIVGYKNKKAYNELTDQVAERNAYRIFTASQAQIAKNHQVIQKPIEKADKENQTDTVQTQQSETQTDTVQTQQRGTQTAPIATSDASTGTNSEHLTLRLNFVSK